MVKPINVDYDGYGDNNNNDINNNMTLNRTQQINSSGSSSHVQKIILESDRLVNFMFEKISQSQANLMNRRLENSSFLSALFCGSDCYGPRYIDLNIIEQVGGDDGGSFSVSTYNRAIHTLRYKYSSDFYMMDAYKRNIVYFVYILLVIVGMLANLLMIYVFYKSDKLRTFRNVFIVNLAISDILLCMIGSPLVLIKHTTFNWTLGRWACKIEQQIQITNVMVTTLCIITIAVDRWQYIVHPGKNIMNRLNSVVYIVLIWAIALLISWPAFMVNDLTIVRVMPNNDVLYSVCEEIWMNSRAKNVYSLFVIGVQYIVPLIIVSTTNLRICNYLIIHVPTSIYSYSFKRRNDLQTPPKITVNLNTAKHLFAKKSKLRSKFLKKIDESNIACENNNYEADENNNNRRSVKMNEFSVETTKQDGDDQQHHDDEQSQNQRLLTSFNNNTNINPSSRSFVSAQTQTPISTTMQMLKVNGDHGHSYLSLPTAGIIKQQQPPNSNLNLNCRTPTISLDNNGGILLGEEGRHEKQDSARFRRSKYLLFFISLSFALCWLPTTIINIIMLFFNKDTINSISSITAVHYGKSNYDNYYDDQSGSNQTVLNNESVIITYSSNQNTTTSIMRMLETGINRQFYAFNGEYLMIFSLLANIIATSSSIINPLLYGLFNTNFKDELIKIFNNLFNNRNKNNNNINNNNNNNNGNNNSRFSRNNNNNNNNNNLNNRSNQKLTTSSANNFKINQFVI